MPQFVSGGLRDDTVHAMSDVSSDFASLRVSALRKASRISSSIDKVTIGPDCTVEYDDRDARWSENLENEKNTCNLSASGKGTGDSMEKKKSDSSKRTGGFTFSVKKILLENEIQRKEEVRRAIELRRRDMEKTEKALQREFELMRCILAMKRESEEAKELERLEAEEEHLAQQNELRRRHEQQLQAQRMRERREKLEREAEEHRKCREREDLVARIGPLRTCFREKCRDIGGLSKVCKDRNSAVHVLAPLANRLKELSAQMEAINERTRSGDVTAADLSTAESVVRQSEEVAEICKSEIARIDALFDEEIARREAAMRQAEAEALAEQAARCAVPIEQSQQQAQEQVVRTSGVCPGELEEKSSASVEAVLAMDPSAPLTPQANEGSSEARGTTTDSSSVETTTGRPNVANFKYPRVKVPLQSSEENVDGDSDYEALRAYMKTHVFLTNYAAAYRELAQAPTLKKFRFECQKAINIPVNAISGVNGVHLKGKYETLKSLLMGKSALNVTQHPQGVAFCKDVLAKKIVSQGETLISSKPEMAFPVAALAVALWIDYPDFGELLLAHFRRTCPYILPVFLPRLQGQTNEEYYRSLGYKYTEDGVVEKQDKYLTRMSGLVRLYAAIIVTERRSGSNEPHPHGIPNAWRWLAVTLNAEPRTDLSDVCATLILDILEVAGNSLWHAYPRQFPKMLTTLAKQYYPRMRTEAGIGGGPMARLEQFIKDCLEKQTIPPPEGALPPNFW